MDFITKTNQQNIFLPNLVDNVFLFNDFYIFLLSLFIFLI
ncbi:hypothetical protein NEOC95_001267 [Neochlamydia sp. AcF95]|nr:hypothetical protein [Neochlamydia sp. AcF95]